MQIYNQNIRKRTDVALFDNVEALFTGLSAFPNMATDVKYSHATSKKKNRQDGVSF